MPRTIDRIDKAATVHIEQPQAFRLAPMGVKVYRMQVDVRPFLSCRHRRFSVFPVLFCLLRQSNPRMYALTRGGRRGLADAVVVRITSADI